MRGSPVSSCWVRYWPVMHVNIRKMKWSSLATTVSRYKEMDDRVNRLANALIAKGIKRGDKVGSLMQNRQELLEVFFCSR